MERCDARLVQYRVLAEHRLHFGRLYFQVIGLNLALVAIAATAIAIGRPAWWTEMRLLAGLLLGATAFVAYRLHHQEETYAKALRAIEQENDGLLELPGPAPHGARQLVVTALATAGTLLAIEAGCSLLWL